MIARVKRSICGFFHYTRTMNMVAAINLLFALLAFLKDTAMAAYLGTSREADLFSLAFFIPDMIGNNLIGAALGVSCVPLFAALFANGSVSLLKQKAIQITKNYLVLSFALCMLIFLLAGPAVRFVAPGLTLDGEMQCTELLVMLLPVLLFAPLITIGGALMQATGSFFAPAFGSVIFHAIGLVGILGLLVFHFPQREGVFWISGLVGAATLAHVVFLGGAFVRKGLPQVQTRERNEKAALQAGVVRIFLPYLLVLASSQLVLAAERYIGSQMETGTIAALNYAYRLSQVPNWVFVSAITTVVLPALARAWGSGSYGELRRPLQRALFAALIVELPVALILCFGGGSIVSILFERGSFDAHSRSLTAQILYGYSLAVVGQAVSSVCLRYFLTVGRLGKIVMCYAATSLCTITLDFVLAKQHGAAAIGWGAAVGSTLNALMMLWLTGRDLKALEKDGAKQDESMRHRHSIV